MTKYTLPLVSIILSSVVLSACTPKVSPPVPTAPTPTPTPSSTEGQAMSVSLRDIINKGGSVQCTFSFKDDQNKTETQGTIYAVGNRFLEEAEVTISGVPKTQKMNIISDGSYIYSWSSDKKIPGMKMKIQVTPTSPSATTSTQVSADLDKKMNMTCVNWVGDSSKFDVPKNINFTDVSEIVPKAKTTGTPQIPAKAYPPSMPGY